MAEETEISFRFVFGRGQGLGGGGEVESDPLDEFVGEAGGGTEVRGGARGEISGGEGESVLAQFPLAEAVPGPFVQVLFGDGTAGEIRGDEGLDFGQGIEPGEDVVVALALVEAAVELFAKGLREVGDFSVHIVFEKSVAEALGQKPSK